MHPIVLVQFSAHAAGAALPQHRADALDRHQETQRAEQQHVADRDRQLDLAGSLEPGEQPDPDPRAGKPAEQQRKPHFEIDIAAPPMRHHPDSEAPTSWLAEEATATAGGTPIKISSGVSRNPPP